MRKIKLNNKNRVKIFLLSSLIFLSACRTGGIVKKAPSTISGIKKILILPFKDMSAVYGENVQVRCPICGKVFNTGTVIEGASEMLAEHLFMLLKKRNEFELIPISHAQGVMSDLLAGTQKEWSDRNLQLETGRILRADAVIVGNVYRFKKRIGSEYSVDSPASVAFDIHLIRVKDGRVLWSGHFDETQRPLSDNLFHLGAFLQRKARWVTAKEMAISGLENMLKTFPNPAKKKPNQ